MDGQNNLQTLYENLINDNYDLPDYNTFKSDMNDGEKRQSLYNNLVNDNYDLPDYNTFSSDMGVLDVKKKSQSEPSIENGQGISSAIESASSLQNTPSNIVKPQGQDAKSGIPQNDFWANVNTEDLSAEDLKKYNIWEKQKSEKPINPLGAAKPIVKNGVSTVKASAGLGDLKEVQDFVKQQSLQLAENNPDLGIVKDRDKDGNPLSFQSNIKIKGEGSVKEILLNNDITNNIANGNIDRAKELHKEAIAENPKNNTYQNALGFKYSSEGKPDIANIYFKNAFETNSDYNTSKYTMLNAVEANDLELANKASDKVLQLNPKNTLSDIYRDKDAYDIKLKLATTPEDKNYYSKLSAYTQLQADKKWFADGGGEDIIDVIGSASTMGMLKGVEGAYESTIQTAEMIKGMGAEDYVRLLTLPFAPLTMASGSDYHRESIKQVTQLVSNAIAISLVMPSGLPFTVATDLANKAQNIATQIESGKAVTKEQSEQNALQEGLFSLVTTGINKMGIEVDPNSNFAATLPLLDLAAFTVLMGGVHGLKKGVKYDSKILEAYKDRGFSPEQLKVIQDKIAVKSKEALNYLESEKAKLNEIKIAKDKEIESSNIPQPKPEELAEISSPTISKLNALNDTGATISPELQKNAVTELITAESELKKEQDNPERTVISKTIKEAQDIIASKIDELNNKIQGRKTIDKEEVITPETEKPIEKVVPKTAKEYHSALVNVAGLSKAKATANTILFELFARRESKRTGVEKSEIYNRNEITKSGVNTKIPKEALRQITVNGKKITVQNIEPDVMNGFYSPIEKNVGELKSDKWGSGQQAFAELKSKGLKADEVKWTGIEEWLKQQGKVTKQEILDYLKNNRVELVEVVKSENGTGTNESVFNDTKFSQYQLEGEKENYREILVTMPQGDSFGKFKWDMNQKYGSDWSKNDLTKEEQDKYLQLRDKTNALPFKSSHWEENNIIGHLRLSNRVDAEGNKVLHITEVQSDWGQTGKKEGFKNEFSPQKITNVREDVNVWVVKFEDGSFLDISKQEAKNENEAKELAQQSKKERFTGKREGVPSAPFVTNTSAWTKLLLKHAIREAVKDGATKITWESGETQAERYDLSKQVDSIYYTDNNDGTFDISATDKSTTNNIFSKTKIDLKEIEGTFGKEIAEKIKNGVGEKNTRRTLAYDNVLSNQDLKIGGSGMKGFYGSPTEGKEGNYRGQHKIVKDETSSPLHNLLESGTAPDDIYTGMKYYGNMNEKSYRESAAAIKAAKGNPEAEITIYRAVPKGVKKINEGDWITLSPTYAKEHGMHHEDSSLDMPVISMKVKAKDVFWDANDLNEFAYFPKDAERGNIGIVGKVAKELVKELTGKEGKIGETKIKLSDNLNAPFDITVKDENGRITTHNFDSKAKASAWLSKEVSNGAKYEVISEKSQDEITTTQHSIEITPELKSAVEKGMPLFQKEKGFVQFENTPDGKAISKVITTFTEKADVSTPIHEIISHPYLEARILESLSGDKKSVELVDNVLSDYNARNGTNIKINELKDKNSKYTKIHEYFTTEFEKYVKNGMKTTRPKLQKVFDSLRDWFKEIFASTSDNVISAKMKTVFRDMFGDEEIETTPKETIGKERKKTSGVYGKEEQIKFSDDLSMPTKYKLIEANELKPSHLPSGERNHEHSIASAQPKERNDKASMSVQDKIAQEPNIKEVGESPNAYFGAPVTNEFGEVIHGNNRSIGLIKHYYLKGIKYKQDLINNAEKFGFTKEQVESMDNPILTREVKVDDNAAISLGQYDVKDLETGGKQRIDPIAISRKIPSIDKSKIVDILFGSESFDTIKKELRDKSKQIFEVLKKHLNPAQMKNTFVKDGNFTAKGIDDAEALITHFMFEGGDAILPEIFDNIPASLQKSLQASMPSILSIEKGKSILPELQKAMQALYDFKNSGIEEFETWKNTIDMFTGVSPKEIFSTEEIALTKFLNETSKQSDIKKLFLNYAEKVSGTPETLFEPAKDGLTKENALKEILKIEEYENKTNIKKGYPETKSETGVTESLSTKEKEVTKEIPTEIEKRKNDAKDKIASGIDGIANKLGTKQNLLPEDITKWRDDIKNIVNGAVELTGIAIEEAIQMAKDYLKKSNPEITENEISEIFNFEKKEKPVNNDFEELTISIPKTDVVKQFLSGETIEKYEGEIPRNNQDYFKVGFKPALEHGIKIIDAAKEKFGDDYVTKTLDYIEKTGIDADNKSLIYLSLEMDLAKQKIEFPSKEYEISKLQDLVREKSQLYMNKLGRGIAFNRLRKFAESGYDIDAITSNFFSTKELETKKKVNESIESNANAINKEAEIQEQENITNDTLSEAIRAGVEEEINNIYNKLPTNRRLQADKYISALEKFQDKLRSRTYDAGIGIPVAIVDAGITTIKQAIKAGVTIADAIELGVNKIKELYGKKWDKENDFRTDMINGFKENGIEIKKNVLTDDERLQGRKNRAKKSIIEINEQIDNKKREIKTRKIIEPDDELKSLLAEKKARLKVLDEVVPDVLKSEKEENKIVAKLEKEIADIDSQIAAGERKQKEKGNIPITTDKIENLKAEKKARLEVLEIVDPIKKNVIKNSLIDAGFGREITVNTKTGKEKRIIIDWKKLAGEEGSVKKIQANVENYLKNKGYSEIEIQRISNSMIKEYNDLRASIIEKSLNELTKGNKESNIGERKAASKRLAEMYNYGLFDKQPDTYNYLMNKVLGISELNQGTFFEIKNIAESLSQLYKSKINGKTIDEYNLAHISNIIDDKIRQLINRAIKENKGTGLLQSVNVLRNFMETSQRMMLNTVKQAIENPLSAAEQSLMTRIGSITDKMDSTDLRKQRNKMMRVIFKDLVLNGSIPYGKTTSQFINRGTLDDYVNGLSDSKIYHGVVSVALGRTFLEGADAMYKSSLTDKYFARNLIKVLTSESNPNGAMKKSDAIKYVTEKLTGQSFKNSQKTAKEIINNINDEYIKKTGKDKKLIPDNEQSIDRLANDIVRQSLLQGEKVTIEQLKASYNSAYKGAGYDLGHEANNPISRMIKLYSSQIETEIRKAVKEKEWNRASMLTLSSIFNRNILNPFVGGGTNWLFLKLQKNGIDIISGIYNHMNKLDMDLASETGIRNLEKTLLNDLKSRNTNVRLLIGGSAAALTYLAMKSTGSDDTYEKWIAKNQWAKKYVNLGIPEAMIAEASLHNEEFAKYLSQAFNKNSAYDDGLNLIKGIDNAVRKGEYSKLGEGVGGMFNAPIPWRLSRDIEGIWRGITGSEQRLKTPKPKGFIDGFFKMGLYNYITSTKGDYLKGIEDSKQEEKIKNSQMTEKERKNKSIEDKRKELNNWYKKNNIDKSADDMSDDKLNSELKEKDKIEEQKTVDYAKKHNLKYKPKRSSKNSIFKINIKTPKMPKFK